MTLAYPRTSSPSVYWSSISRRIGARTHGDRRNIRRATVMVRELHMAIVGAPVSVHLCVVRRARATKRSVSVQDYGPGVSSTHKKLWVVPGVNPQRLVHRISSENNPHRRARKHLEFIVNTRPVPSDATVVETLLVVPFIVPRVVSFAGLPCSTWETVAWPFRGSVSYW